MNAGLQPLLRKCDDEPVHLPGAIQACGALLAFDSRLARALKASANLKDFLGIDAVAALDCSAAELLGPRLTARLAEELPRAVAPVVVAGQRAIAGQRADLHLTAYYSGERIVVEIERPPRRSRRRPLAQLTASLERLAVAESPIALLDELVGGIQLLTGHERVMVYQFDADWHGTVVAEACSDAVPGFLGHRFPASDIPPQVRDIYAINPLRLIADVQASALPLVPHEAAGSAGALDLSFGVLRAVSPIHLRYLDNMGVRSACSLAIQGPNGLWGLVACHGLRPRALTPAVRDAALSLVRMSAQRLFLLQAHRDTRYLQRVLDVRELISTQREQPTTPECLVRENGPAWLDLFRACGLSLVLEEGSSTSGRTPPTATIERIAGWLTNRRPRNEPWSTHNLEATELARFGDLADCHGMLALPLEIGSPPGWLLLFRPEVVDIRRWAGDVRAPAELTEDGKALTPRRSFDTWVEQVRGRAREWLPIEIQAASDLAEDLAVAASVHRIARLNTRLEEANRHLSTLAETDALTQVANRYRMERALDDEIAAAQRYGRSCAVILLDIDHFKRFNDEHGHAAGDRVLQGVATELAAGLRDTDRLGRWGGEEFLVLAASSRAGETVQLAERLRKRIAGLDFGPLGGVSFSAGVAEWQPGDTRRRLVERADQALYRAKAGGRNRVCSGSAD